MRQLLSGRNPVRRKSLGSRNLWRTIAAVVLLLAVGISGLPPTIMFEVEGSEPPVEERENEQSEEFIGTRSPLRVGKHRKPTSFLSVGHKHQCRPDSKPSCSAEGHCLPNGLPAPLIC